MSKTFSLKASEVKREWVLFDAAETTLGRLASAIATQLMGKHRPNFTPHVDSGNYVVVVNAAKIQVTGNKLADKRYYRHSQYPGGIKDRTLAEQLERDPAAVINAAVKGMLPKNKLQAGRLARLKVFSGEEHAHTAQQPTKLGVNR